MAPRDPIVLTAGLLLSLATGGACAEVHRSVGHDLGGAGTGSTTVWWVDSARERGVQFDILGLSCYTTTQGSPDTWQEHLTFPANRYTDLQFAAAEYSQEKRRANDIICGLPGGRGLGTFIFEPIYWYETLFDEVWPQFNANSLISLYDQMASDYGLR
jgi:arabinogalactan endo-1,4-beta-galactosidase